MANGDGASPATVELIQIELAPVAYRVSGDRVWSDSRHAQQSARWVAGAASVAPLVRSLAETVS
ncbi:MAG TPA: hypothetical protein VNH40_10730 [Gaiellaceae bacterium]|nr:hypothetical protein [Gaiellaceae bacterium]